MRILFGILLFLLFSVGRAESASVIVPDKDDCEYLLRLEKFLNKTRVAAGEIQDFEYCEQIVGWYDGYVSARNIYDPSVHGNVHNGITFDKFAPWLFDFCGENPTGRLIQAVEIFFRNIHGEQL
jgi:hypothetical protein